MSDKEKPRVIRSQSAARPTERILEFEYGDNSGQISFEQKDGELVVTIFDLCNDVVVFILDETLRMEQA